MTDQHSPITPPPELVKQWNRAALGDKDWLGSYSEHLATQAARWGSDQELEACCEELKSIPSPLGIPFGEMASNALRSSRRPKPLSLKEQAKQAWYRFMDSNGHDSVEQEAEDYDTIRRALESIND